MNKLYQKYFELLLASQNYYMSLDDILHGIIIMGGRDE